ncbi:NACHT domain-containing protein [Leptolyngbyaceae cyanobacterium UHCC 1019]
MVDRSLRASEAGVKKIRKAMNRDSWTQQNLADAPDLKVSRSTIGNFANGKPVDRWIFEEACRLLDLLIKDIAEPEEETPDPSIVELVSKARSQIQTYTQERCGTMRVLDMTQPIDLDNIYIQVNILHKLTRSRGSELAELLREGSLENFDRFCIGNVQQKRVPGLEAVEKFSKLMILGKPGAGKTTFLKHLAMQCIDGKFQGDRVPFFITLKEFAEEKGEPGLLEFCDRLARMGAIELFRNGRALVLLDGLDEVREADASRVLRQIQQFSVQFPGNQFVITCRIAAREYTFEQFTEVEVADFNPEQVAEFVGNWFNHKNDPVKAERFLAKLKDEKAIAELATSPLLLTLLCLVFENSGSFPSNRAELYGTGVEVLLKKWDTKRNIDRQQVYKGLSLKRKEDLLSYVARSTFEAGNYFFKQREAERLIGEYIQNLPNADPAALEVDSGAVLKAIEAQHGLFVERARNIYSFSHLTFHEYFAARGIVESRDPAALQALATHITEKRWREVFLRVTELLPNADEWLRMMKAEVNSLLAKDEKLQEFLRWVDEKARSITSQRMSEKLGATLAA